MIVLLTDFGATGPYQGQMTAVLAREAPGVPVVSLFSDLPAFNPRAAAYLLAAYSPEFPVGTVFLSVVDPGVGSERDALALEADGRWFVGPDNGLLAIAARQAGHAEHWTITWRPTRLSASFHGRDLFAPVAARLARGMPVPGERRSASCVGDDWPSDLAEVVYVDHYGNAITGLRASRLDPEDCVEVAGRTLEYRRTFSEATPGEAFWYQNANGLVEIAVNGGSAAQVLGLSVGAPADRARQG
jgi:S-adenosylmethionine hydrolase